VPHVAPCAAYSSHEPAAVQQPLGQVLASQVQLPLVVSQRPFAHGPQATPADPHCVGVCEP